MLAALWLAGCAELGVAKCPVGLRLTPVAEMFFGRNIGGKEGVIYADWARFVDQEITPRFPAGLTVIDGQGQWRAADGVLVHERSKLVLIVLPRKDSDQNAQSIEAVRSAYKTRFHQESVMLIRRTACVEY